MKKHKRLFAVLFLLLIIFASLAIPVGAETDYRNWDGLGKILYSGVSSFKIDTLRYDSFGDLINIGYSYNSLKPGNISYYESDGYSMFFGKFSDYYSNLYGYQNFDVSFEQSDSFFGQYDVDESAVYYAAGRVLESSSLYSDLFYQTKINFLPFVIDQNIVKDLDFLEAMAYDQESSEYIQFLMLPEQYYFDIVVNMDVVSLVDGSTYSLSDYTETLTSAYVPLFDISWLPDIFVSGGDVPVGPPLPDQDFSLVQISNLTIDVEFHEGASPAAFGVMDTVIAYSDGDPYYTQSIDVPLNLLSSRDISGDNNGSYQDAYNNGYNAGVSVGRNEGYNAGINAGANGSWTAWIGTAVGGFMSFELFNGITLGGILIVCIAFGLVFLFLKYFAGG